MAELGLDADLRLGLRRALDAAARNPRLTLCAGCGERGVGSCGCLANLERAKPTRRIKVATVVEISAESRRRWFEAFSDPHRAVEQDIDDSGVSAHALSDSHANKGVNSGLVARATDSLPGQRLPRRKYQARPKPGPRIIRQGGQKIVLPPRYANALVSPLTPAETLEAIYASVERVASLPPAIRRRLSFHEADALALLVLEGLTNQQIAARLGIRHEGVRGLFRKIYRKLGERCLEFANVAERFENVQQFSWKV